MVGAMAHGHLAMVNGGYFLRLIQWRMLVYGLIWFIQWLLMVNEGSLWLVFVKEAFTPWLTQGFLIVHDGHDRY